MARPRSGAIEKCTPCSLSANSTFCIPPGKSSTSANARGSASGVAMQLSLKDELPVIPIRLGHHGTALDIPDVLIDTGSARTIFAADMVAHLGVLPAADDILYAIRGVGGRE